MLYFYGWKYLMNIVASCTSKTQCDNVAVDCLCPSFYNKPTI